MTVLLAIVPSGPLVCLVGCCLTISHGFVTQFTTGVVKRLLDNFLGGRITVYSRISREKNNSHFAVLMKKSRFTVYGYVTKAYEKKSHFTIHVKKRPFTDHEKTLYHPQDTIRFKSEECSSGADPGTFHAMSVDVNSSRSVGACSPGTFFRFYPRTPFPAS